MPDHIISESGGVYVLALYSPREFNDLTSLVNISRALFRILHCFIFSKLFDRFMPFDDV